MLALASLQSVPSLSPSLSSSGSMQSGWLSPSKFAKESTSEPLQFESIASQDSGAPV